MTSTTPEPRDRWTKARARREARRTVAVVLREFLRADGRQCDAEEMGTHYADYEGEIAYIASRYEEWR